MELPNVDPNAARFPGVWRKKLLYTIFFSKLEHTWGGGTWLLNSDFWKSEPPQNLNLVTENIVRYLHFN